MSQYTLVTLVLIAIICVFINADIIAETFKLNRINEDSNNRSNVLSKLMWNNHNFLPRKKDNRYLWPLGIAIAGVAATVFGIFIKIIWSVSMLSTMMSAASIILSGILSIGGAHAHRRNEPLPEQYVAEKRLDAIDFQRTINAADNIHDFTTQYSTNHL